MKPYNLRQKERKKRALTISNQVAQTVKIRDNNKCVLCGSGRWSELHHVIFKSQGGMGVEQNVVCLCKKCHVDLHSSPRSKELKLGTIDYLKSIYPNWKKDIVIYKKLMYN